MFGPATAGGGSIDLPGCPQRGKRGTKFPISNKDSFLSSHSSSITDLPFTSRRISSHSWQPEEHPVPMTTFQLRKKTSLEQKQSNILADVLTTSKPVQSPAVLQQKRSYNRAMLEVSQGTIPQAPGAPAISFIVILHARCRSYSLHQDLLETTGYPHNSSKDLPAALTHQGHLLAKQELPKASGTALTAPGNCPSVCLVSATLGKASRAADSKARIKVSGAAGITGKRGDKTAGKQVGNFLPPGSRRNTPSFPTPSPLGPPSCWKYKAGSHSQYSIMHVCLLF